MPLNLLTRLFRPFSQTAALSIVPESGAATAIPEGAQRCTVAAGCFWGIEHVYRKHFTGKGLIDAKVGYIGGDLNNPTYRAVCGGKTGRMLSLFVVSSLLSPNTKFRYANLTFLTQINRRRSRRDRLRPF